MNRRAKRRKTHVVEASLGNLERCLLALCSHHHALENVLLVAKAPILLLLRLACSCRVNRFQCCCKNLLGLQYQHGISETFCTNSFKSQAILNAEENWIFLLQHSHIRVHTCTLLHTAHSRTSAHMHPPAHAHAHAHAQTHARARAQKEGGREKGRVGDFYRGCGATIALLRNREYDSC